jgi:hypothetical protein
MISSQKSTDYLLAEMQSKGLASTGSSWLEKAIIQKAPALTVGVASSRLLVYDRLDRRIAFLSPSN